MATRPFIEAKAEGTCTWTDFSITMSNRGSYFRAAILENQHANQPSEWIDLILHTKARKAMRVQELSSL